MCHEMLENNKVIYKMFKIQGLEMSFMRIKNVQWDT